MLQDCLGCWAVLLVAHLASNAVGQHTYTCARWLSLAARRGTHRLTLAVMCAGMSLWNCWRWCHSGCTGALQPM